MIFRRITLIVAAVAAMTVVVPASASATPSYCGITWGSVEKNAPFTAASELENIRSGRHDCYDRLVFDFRGNTQGYHVTYVDEVTEDGSGRPVPLRGAGKLQVTVGGPAYDEAGNPTYTFADRAELLNVAGYQTFRQVAWAGSFEGTTTVGLGVRARLPFRVLSLPNRIVVDVAHFW
jgi:hypothetical protein